MTNETDYENENTAPDLSAFDLSGYDRADPAAYEADHTLAIALHLVALVNVVFAGARQAVDDAGFEDRTLRVCPVCKKLHLTRAGLLFFGRRISHEEGPKAPKCLECDAPYAADEWAA
jgi:hypothetical protein